MTPKAATKNESHHDVRRYHKTQATKSSITPNITNIPLPPPVGVTTLAMRSHAFVLLRGFTCHDALLDPSGRKSSVEPDFHDPFYLLLGPSRSPL